MSLAKACRHLSLMSHWSAARLAAGGTLRAHAQRWRIVPGGWRAAQPNWCRGAGPVWFAVAGRRLGSARSRRTRFVNCPGLLLISGSGGECPEPSEPAMRRKPPLASSSEGIDVQLPSRRCQRSGGQSSSQACTSIPPSRSSNWRSVICTRFAFGFASSCRRRLGRFRNYSARGKSLHQDGTRPPAPAWTRLLCFPGLPAATLLPQRQPRPGASRPGHRRPGERRRHRGASGEQVRLNACRAQWPGVVFPVTSACWLDSRVKSRARQAATARRAATIPRALICLLPVPYDPRSSPESLQDADLLSGTEAGRGIFCQIPLCAGVLLVCFGCGASPEFRP